MSQCLTVIPARLASTRFPEKVLARLGGRTMIEWCWRNAKSAGIGPVIVAVDDRRVAAEVKRFGGISLMTPPSCPSGSDRVWLAAAKRREPVVMNYQGDMPLLSPETLRAVARCLRKTDDIATAVIRLSDERRARNINVVKAVLAQDGRCLYFSRAPVPSSRENSPVLRWEHLGLYAYSRRALKRFVSLPPSPLELAETLEQLRALEAGFLIRAITVNEPPVSVDTPADLRLAESLLKHQGLS